MSYNKKKPLIRVDSSFDDYLTDLSKTTGLPKTMCSKLLATKLRRREINMLKNRKHKGMNFDFKI